jgi:adenylate cyclase
MSGPKKPAASHPSGKPQSLDIYCRLDRRWRLQERLPPNDMDAAVARAQYLDTQPGVEGVRIMMPTLGTSVRKPIELMVWVSPRLEKDLFKSGVALKRHTASAGATAAVEAEAAAGGSLSDAMVAPPPLEPEPRKPPSKPKERGPGIRILAKIAGVASASVGLALLLTFSAAAAMPHLAKMGLIPSGIGRANLLYGVFLVSLLSGMAGIGSYFIRLEELGWRLRGREGAPMPAGPAAEDRAGDGAPESGTEAAGKPEGDIHDFLEEAKAEKAERMLAEARGTFRLPEAANPVPEAEIPPPGPVPEALPDPVETAETAIVAVAPPPPFVPPAMDFASLPIPAVAAEEESAPAEAEAAPARKKPRKPGREHKVMLVEFLQETIIAVKDRVRRLDAHTAFGLHLFLGGACHAYAERRQLADKSRLELMTLAVAALGAKPDRVRSFLSNFEEYGRDSKYRAMIKCGRSVMGRKLDGDVAAFQELAAAMDAWCGGQAGEAAFQGVVTIMFTDIVGSTKMTRERGDFGAQEAVRAHNAIVRNALAYNGGREVKHTGDGIMATFPSAAGAVRAAQAIQRDLERRNATPGQAPVNVRIGLNAGDVVREENDIYGAAVQLSARTCDKAGAGQIYATRSVRDLTQGHDIAYTEAGLFAMKGIDGDVALYEVGWRD